MKKLLLSSSIATLLLPSLVFAAYNDVSLTTNTVLSVSGITLNVSGDTATIESIVVDSTNFTVTLASGSSFEVTAPGLNVLSTDTQVGLTATYCDGSRSSLAYTATGALTVIITPSTTLCTSVGGGSSGGGSSSSSSSSGGGGGGTPAPQASPVAVVATSVNSPSIMTPAEKQAAIAQIRAALIPLIQQLIVLLQQQIASM